MRNYIEQLKKLSSADLVKLCLVNADDNDIYIRLLHQRGGRGELAIAIELCGSNDCNERILGADLLSQLGCGDRRFVKESAKPLRKLLSDNCFDVIEAAVYALGHLEIATAIPKLLPLKEHHLASIREAVAYSLGIIGDCDDSIIAALIELSKDEVSEVRSWATFALGSQLSNNNDPVIKALCDRLNDEDYEVRTEAITGLVRRNHPEMTTYMQQWLSYEIEQEEILLISLEAAELLASPKIYDQLVEIKTLMKGCDDPDLLEQLGKALFSCRKDGINNRPSSGN